MCGKFRAWDDLRFRWAAEMVDIYGGIEETEWFECLTCSPEKV